MNIQQGHPTPKTDHEANTLDAALRALERTTGIQGRAITKEMAVAANRRADAEIEITIDNHNYRFVAEIKTVDRFVVLGNVKTQLQQFGKRGLLIAPYLTLDLADRCKEMDLHFIDTAGNAFLRAPGLFVYVTGQRRTQLETPPPAFRALNATGLRVIFALLCEPALLNAPYREINQAAGVALGTVGWVFYDLNARGLLIDEDGKRKRRFLQPKRLLEEWVANYPIKLRPKLGARRFRAQTPDWWKNVHLEQYRAYWGGEVAADRLTGYLKPKALTIYTRDDPTKLILDNRLRADVTGDIEILQTFWRFYENTPEPLDVAPPLLVYADLMATLEPRNLEAAQQIYERHLANAFD